MRVLYTKKTIFFILTWIMLLLLYNAAKNSSNETLSDFGELDFASDRLEKSEVIQNVSKNKVKNSRNETLSDFRTLEKSEVIQNVSKTKVKNSSNETLSDFGELLSDRRNRMLEKSEVIQNVSKNKVNLKYILQWTSPLNVPFVYMGKAQDGFIERKCPYTNCIVTADRSYLDNDITKFDVITFAGPEVVFYGISKLPEKRSPHQKYVFASVESSDNYPLCTNTFNKYFNWTWTFRLDSEVRWGYLTIRDKNKAIIGPNKVMHWIKLEDMDPVSDDFKQQLKRKTKAAVWFVSNCNTRSGRERLADKLNKELQRFELNLDIYGTCGPLKCSRDSKDDCDKIIKFNYHFYLSFENSLSEDYVTEKLFRALNNDAVPIVYGGANYTRFMPDGIYLDAGLLNTEELAKKMYELINDPKKYAEYFKWKNHYSYHLKSESVETDPYCLFCTTLNDEKMVKTTTIYDDFRNWWTSPPYTKPVCQFTMTVI